MRWSCPGSLPVPGSTGRPDPGGATGPRRSLRAVAQLLCVVLCTCVVPAGCGEATESAAVGLTGTAFRKSFAYLCLTYGDPSAEDALEVLEGVRADIEEVLESDVSRSESEPAPRRSEDRALVTWYAFLPVVLELLRRHHTPDLTESCERYVELGFRVGAIAGPVAGTGAGPESVAKRLEEHYRIACRDMDLLAWMITGDGSVVGAGAMRLSVRHLRAATVHARVRVPGGGWLEVRTRQDDPRAGPPSVVLAESGVLRWAIEIQRPLGGDQLEELQPQGKLEAVPGLGYRLTLRARRGGGRVIEVVLYMDGDLWPLFYSVDDW